jgi:hypothetical protein
MPAAMTRHCKRLTLENIDNALAPRLSTPENLMTLTQVEERVLQLVERSYANSHQIGLLYNYVVDKNLALTGGFKDAHDFFKQRIKVLSQATLSTYGAVATKFSEAVSLKYGMDKLYALLTYAKRASLQVDGNEPGPTLIAVPQEDGTVAQKPFSECSREDLRQAAKHQRSPEAPMTELDVARVKRYQESLDRHLPAKHGIRVVARREEGRLRLTLRNVPEDWMERLVEVLAPPAPVLPAAPSPDVAQGVPPMPLQGAPQPQQTPIPLQPHGAAGGLPPRANMGLRGLLRQAFLGPTGS